MTDRHISRAELRDMSTDALLRAQRAGELDHLLSPHLVTEEELASWTPEDRAAAIREGRAEHLGHPAGEDDATVWARSSEPGVDRDVYDPAKALLYRDKVAAMTPDEVIAAHDQGELNPLLRGDHRK